MRTTYIITKTDERGTRELAMLFNQEIANYEAARYIERGLNGIAIEKYIP